MRRTLLFLLMTAAGCGLFEDPDDVSVARDAGTSSSDGGMLDAGTPDGNGPDANPPNNTAPDTGSVEDLGPDDAGSTGDGGSGSDTGMTPDSGMMSTGPDCLGPALADTTSPDVTVGSGTPDSCDQASLQAAADAGGTVTFNCGAAAHTITLTSPIKLTDDVVIDGGDMVTLSGGGSSRILEIAVLGPAPRPVVKLQRIRLTNGFVPSTDTKCGAAIRRTGGKLYVVDVEFNSNRCEAMARGGAILSTGAEITEVSGSSFTGNTAEDGGAIAGSVIVSDTKFTANTATKWGGAIAAVGGRIEVCGSTFRGNVTGELGGGLFFTATAASDPTVIVERSSFVSNEAGQGGGLYSFGAHTEIRSSLFDGNKAATSAGARLQDGTVTLENTTVVNNEATSGLAGGFGLLSVSGTARNMTFVANDASGFGGATVGGANVVLSNSVFDKNYGANVFEDQTCRDVMTDGGGNVQWPEKRPSDQDDGLCTDGVLLADPLVSDYDPTLGVVPLTAGSPAIGIGVDCPNVDQLGNSRPAEGCNAGAYQIVAQ